MKSAAHSSLQRPVGSAYGCGSGGCSHSCSSCRHHSRAPQRFLTGRGHRHASTWDVVLPELFSSGITIKPPELPPALAHTMVAYE